MARTPQRDNVIYVNFGAKANSPLSPATSGADYAAQLPEGQSVAGAALLSALTLDTDSGRINRGRSYAANNMVATCRLQPGSINGIVTGSQPTPFTTTITISLPNAAQVETATRDLLSTPGSRDALYDRIASPEVVSFVLDGRPWEQPFTTPITADLEYDCNCPDFARGNVCKHCVAVATVAANYFDADPTRILELTHINLEQLSLAHGAAQATMNTVRAQRPGGGDDGPSHDEFWSGSPLPPIPGFTVRNTLQEGDNSALRSALRHVTYARLEELRIIDELADIFDTLTTTASFDDPETGLLAQSDAWGGYTRFGSVDDLPDAEAEQPGTDAEGEDAHSGDAEPEAAVSLDLIDEDPTTDTDTAPDTETP